ncbi:hypothetical protein KBC75_01965 [Candidatus Shapirobacteria bacterium]|nr:hypothetical protein [Candidatus Shapirobacteria bacterium]
MNFPLKIDLWSIAGKVGVIFVGFIVLAVSLTQTTLRIMAVDEIRNNPMELTINYKDGTTEQASYKFPEVNMLPDNPFYGLKRVRDWMWLLMTSKQNKPKVALLLADKKIAEMTELFKKDKSELAIETGNEALDKLEYAHGLESDVSQIPDEVKRFRKQLFLAGNAYSQILNDKKENFELNQVKFDELNKKINDWNKKQEEESWQWKD